MKRVRTTIVLPEEDVRLIKILAANYGLTMSEVVQQSVRTADLTPKKNKTSLLLRNKKELEGWRAVAGSLHLGGKEPPTRQEIYDRYLK